MVSPAQLRTWVRWAQDAYAVSERTACEAGAGHRRDHAHIKACRDQAIRQRAMMHTGRLEGDAYGLGVLVQVRDELLDTFERIGEASLLAFPIPLDEDNMCVFGDVNGHPRSRGGGGQSRRTGRWSVVIGAPDGTGSIQDAADWSGWPSSLRMYYGTEFTALDHWCDWNQVRVDFSRPGKSTDNAAIESFHNSFRRECLTQHDFIDITDAQHHIEQYRSEYNNDHL